MSGWKRFGYLLLALLIIGSYATYRMAVKGDSSPQRGRSHSEKKARKEAGEVGETSPEEGAAPPAPTAVETPETAPQPPPDPQALAPGFEHISKGELEEAKEFFLEHIRLYPIDPEGHYGLGVAYRGGDEFDQSIDEFAKTLLLNPSHLQAKYQVAEMLTFQLKEDFDTAEQFYNEILEQAPEERSAVNGLATVYLSTGRTDEAIHLWENLQKETPDEVAVGKNLGEAYFVKGSELAQSGNVEEAKEWIAKARELNPDDPVYQEKSKELGLSSP